MQIMAYLDHPLTAYDRVRKLTELADAVAARPVSEVVDDLRGVLAARDLTGEDHHRLHVLLSQLYHASGAPDATGDLVDALRTDVTEAWDLCRSRAQLLDARRE
jgi:hypothetical protein